MLVGLSPCRLQKPLLQQKQNRRPAVLTGRNVDAFRPGSWSWVKNFCHVEPALKSSAGCGVTRTAGKAPEKGPAGWAKLQVAAKEPFSDRANGT